MHVVLKGHILKTIFRKDKFMSCTNALFEFLFYFFKKCLISLDSRLEHWSISKATSKSPKTSKEVKYLWWCWCLLCNSARKREGDFRKHLKNHLNCRAVLGFALVFVRDKWSWLALTPTSVLTIIIMHCPSLITF